MIIPLLVVVGGYLGYKAIKKRKAMSSKERQIFEAAFNNLREPKKLKQLADAFRNQGFAKEADLLEKRIALRQMTPQQYKQNRAAFDKAMSSKDPAKVKEMATLFEQNGAIGAAAALRKYADTLKAA